jgi:hypothetical protein
LQSDPAQDLWPAAPGVEPNTLYPDGAHLQPGQSPAYKAQPNFPATPPAVPASNHGALGFWLKANKELSFNHEASFVVCARLTGGASHVFAVGRYMQGDIVGCLIENRAWAGGDINYEIDRVILQRDALNRSRFPGMRWQLVTVFWDTDESRNGRDADIILHDLLQDNLGYVSREMSYPGPLLSLNPGLGEDLLDPSVCLVLGCQDIPMSPDNFNYTDAVLDEFAVYDFGDNAAAAKPLSDGWALTRYQDGRYYKGEDAAFTSAALQPHPGEPIRLLAATWTAYLPSESRQEICFGDGILPAAGTPRLVDARLAKSSLAVSLQLPSLPPIPLSQGTPIGRVLQGFQYQVAFRTGIPRLQLLSEPVLESPWFDDITFSWQPMTGQKIMAWERP